eukprot:s448_g41.t1
MQFSFPSFYACILAGATGVYAARLEEDIHELDQDLDLADFSSGRRPARVIENFSPEEMQGRLLKFLETSRVHDWPKIKHPDHKENKFINEALGKATQVSCAEWVKHMTEERAAEAHAAKAEVQAAWTAQAHNEHKAAKKKAEKFGNKKLKKEADEARKRFLKANDARAKAKQELQNEEVKKVSVKQECDKEVGCLAQDLMDACQTVEMKPRTGKGRSVDDPWTTCFQSVKDIFFHGRNVVQAWQVGSFRSAPDETKPLFTKGDLLQQWIGPLATPEKAAILWAGFWTDATDPDGSKSRISKENLFDFADLVETQTVHPSTDLGGMVDKYNALAGCQGHMENGLKHNMWSFFSFSFVAGMREKKQDLVVVLVNKKLEGERKLSDSVLSQYEIPSIGVAAWRLGFWSPQVVVIDFLGNCANTGPMLRQRLYSRLARSTEETNFLDPQDFVRRSKLSWTCLDCPEKRCKLDRLLAEQVNEILEAKRKQDEKGDALMKAVKEGEVAIVQNLLNHRADVNFQDEDGNTALFLAAKGGDMAKAKLLLERGAYVGARNFQGKTPLFKATPEIAKFLLDKGATCGADEPAAYSPCLHSDSVSGVLSERHPARTRAFPLYLAGNCITNRRTSCSSSTKMMKHKDWNDWILLIEVQAFCRQKEGRYAPQWKSRCGHTW